MCGIFGVVSWSRPIGEERVLAAHRVQAHRGPDGAGTWRGRVGRCEVVLGHQRLSIIDLSDAAAQPMVDPDGRSILAYNGELYNYLELRAEMTAAGESFRTSSDTEVLQKALHHWGVEPALARANGMWAFAWIDERGERLVLSRDRGSEKPLYLARDGDVVCFASEMKTLFALLGGRRTIDAQVAGEYLLQAAVDTSERTFFAGVSKLPPAAFAVLDLSAPPCDLAPRPYWRCPTQAPPRPLPDLIAQTRETFLDAVRIRLRSDVPVGVLLSGGIDSSAIAAAVHHLGGVGLDMLSAVSRDRRFDESRFVDVMTSHLGRAAHKVELDLEPAQAMELLRDVSWYNDEPAVSFTSVAHYLLMRKAADLGLKVILSGQGADEMLCGYRKYVGFAAEELVRSGRVLEAAGLVYGFWRNGTILNQFSLAEARRYMPGRRGRREPGIAGPALDDFVPVSLGLGKGSVQERQAADLTRFSVPALCHYEDRMSMANGREIRLPFLDHRLIELLVPAPVDVKLRKGWTKYVFREAMRDLLPPEIAWRKDKQGFVSPQGEWLKHELRPAVLDHFGPDALMVKAGLVDHDALARRYEAYCRQPAGAGNIWFRDIFSPLALEVWMRRFEDHLA